MTSLFAAHSERAKRWRAAPGHPLTPEQQLRSRMRSAVSREMALLPVTSVGSDPNSERVDVICGDLCDSAETGRSRRAGAATSRPDHREGAQPGHTPSTSRSISQPRPRRERRTRPWATNTTHAVRRRASTMSVVLPPPGPRLHVDNLGKKGDLVDVADGYARTSSFRSAWR